MHQRIFYICIIFLMATGCQSHDKALTKQQKCREIANELHQQVNPHTTANQQNQHYLNQTHLTNQWHKHNCDTVLHDTLTVTTSH